MKDKKLEEKIRKILLASKFDLSSITYWDGCLPEIMEVINQEKLELIERVREEVIEENDKCPFHPQGCERTRNALVNIIRNQQRAKLNQLKKEIGGE